jgi:hypothetical protein
MLTWWNYFTLNGPLPLKHDGMVLRVKPRNLPILRIFKRGPVYLAIDDWNFFIFDEFIL